jgi:hypothetical protein
LVVQIGDAEEEYRREALELEVRIAEEERKLEEQGPTPPSSPPPNGIQCQKIK